MSEDPTTRFRENVTEITAMIVTGVWLAAMFTGQSWWLPALLLGYIVVVPIVALLFGDEEDRHEWWDWWDDESWDDRDDEVDESAANDDENDDSTADNRDALETLRERYARGELTDAQFERKLERLLETDTLESADERARERRLGEQARGRYDGRDNGDYTERNRDVEYES